MNRKQFQEEFLPRLHKWELETSSTKGEEYAGMKDVARNFKIVAEVTGLTPYQVCAVYMHKQFDAIMNFAKQSKVLSTETLRSRVGDLRLYAALLLEMAEEAGDA